MTTEFTYYTNKHKVKDQFVYSIIDWHENDSEIFKIKLFYQDDTWTGTFYRKSAQDFLEDTGDSEEEYISVIKEGLTSNNLFTWDFVKLSDSSANLIWDKHYEGSSAVLRYASLVVSKDDASEESFIDFLLNENRSLKKVIEDVKIDNKCISDELEKCKQELNKYADIKEDLKKCLYGKFVKILNAKKKRVRFLEQQLLQNRPEEKMGDDSD